LHKQVRSSGGPMTILLTRTKASGCTMELVSHQALYLAWRTTSTQLDLSDNVAPGTYSLDVSCLDTRVRPYALAIQSLLPTSG
jgi:hypothetical protein